MKLSRIDMYNPYIFLPAGRIQVTTPVDREEKKRQNQRMYWPAERFVTRTSETVGETMTQCKKFLRAQRTSFYMTVSKLPIDLPFFSVDARTFGESSRPGVNTETLKRTDCCH